MNQLSLFKNDQLSLENVNNSMILNDIPFEHIYASARKEASRKKPVFFIHKYFARRITANYRLMLLSTLLPKNSNIISEFYSSNVIPHNKSLTVLDPFMGGGTIIFESERVNAKTIGNDLQPLSKFITDCTISSFDEGSINKAIEELDSKVGKKIKSFYKTTCPHCNKKADVMYNFHVKRVSTSSKCKEHDLFTSYVLSRKKNKYTLSCPECSCVFDHSFEHGAGHCPDCDFKIDNPKLGKVKKGIFFCEECGETHNLRELEEKSGYPQNTKVYAQEYCCPHCSTHGYKKAYQEDVELYQSAVEEYENLKYTLPIPSQKIPEGYNTRQMINHGYNYFSDMFNKRQLLCLGLLLKAIDEISDQETKKWLMLAFSGMLEMNNMFCRYQSNASKLSNMFFNHAYVPISMPVENNVWGAKLGTGSFIKTMKKIARGKNFNTDIYDIYASEDFRKKPEKIYSSNTVQSSVVKNFKSLEINQPLLMNGDSRKLREIPDNGIDIVLTDPPYGANVMYAELIDFFHVWMHSSSYGKSIGFNEPYSPKVEELIINKLDKTYTTYTDGLTEVFSEMSRVTKEDSLLIFSFHDKDIKSWHSIIQSIQLGGFNLVKAYPLHSETRSGAHTSNKNSIGIDIFLVCQKRKSSITSNKGIRLEKINDLAMKTTQEYIERLLSVKAEITPADIENVFISQFFLELYKDSSKVSYTDQEIEEFLKEQFITLEDIFDNSQITSSRTGWWSELYKEKF